MDSSGALMDNTHVIRVPEYFYAVDINYLTHMIGKNLIKMQSFIVINPPPSLWSTPLLSLFIFIDS